ncbi:MAG: alpha/beta hydrolase [Acetobacteraceae bacterium]|nr:alpha/beta hydrolase [Acetobacteraceae bacterium]MSP29518.1 alpha/beta hydrolase [Acetobacteraceae bacterium]
MTKADILAFCPPSLWLYGATSFPFEARIADQLCALRPYLSVITIEDAGHNVHQDEAAAVNQAAFTF